MSKGYGKWLFRNAPLGIGFFDNVSSQFPRVNFQQGNISRKYYEDKERQEFLPQKSSEKIY